MKKDNRIAAYLDDKTRESLETYARREGLSLSMAAGRLIGLALEQPAAEVNAASTDSAIVAHTIREHLDRALPEALAALLDPWMGEVERRLGK